MTLAINPGRPRAPFLIFHTAAVSPGTDLPDGLPGGFILNVGGTQTFLTEAEAVKLSTYIENASHATP